MFTVMTLMEKAAGEAGRRANMGKQTGFRKTVLPRFVAPAL
jgi:hypothetical protein